MQRVVIIGGSGTGKSTLAKNLGKVLQLPVYHLDALNYEKDWKPVGKEKRDAAILSLCKQDRWVIEGNYSGTLKARVERADLVLFLSYSTLAQLKGVVSRLWKNRGKEKEELPGCREKADREFLSYVIHWNRRTKKKIEKILQEIPQEKIVRFHTRRELNNWYEINFQQKIVK